MKVIFWGECKKIKLTIFEITINHVYIFNPVKQEHLRIILK